MNTTVEWQQCDDYYWSGPAGWTICRVWIDGTYQFELWHSADGALRRIDAKPSLQAAKDLYQQQIQRA